MKYLIDNNLSHELISALRPILGECFHVRDVMAITASDLIIWDYCKKNNPVIITKDNDFDERSFFLGCPPKVIRLLCGNKSTRLIQENLILNQDIITSFSEDDFENCLLKIAF